MRVLSKEETMKWAVRLQILADCYSEGRFESLFPLLSDNIILSSMWVLSDKVGREEVEEYYTGKGETLRKKNCCPICRVVKLKTGFYNDVDIAILSYQVLDGKKEWLTMTIQLDSDDRISRIALCDPTLYEYSTYEMDEETGKLLQELKAKVEMEYKQK